MEQAILSVRMDIKSDFVKEKVKTGYTEEDDPFWNEANQTRLRKAMQDIKAGKNLVRKTMSELKAMEL
jgi:hypothetical protein